MTDLGDKVHDFQEGIGESGRFGEFFVALGALILFAGAMSMLSAWLHFPFFPFEGDEPLVEMIQTAGLFVLEGAGFIVFGIMAIRSGWARNHPESDL